MLHLDWRDVPFIGLSATPWTKGLGSYYEKLIIAASTEKLIDAGILSNFKVFAPAHPDLKACAPSPVTITKATSAMR